MEGRTSSSDPLHDAYSRDSPTTPTPGSGSAGSDEEAYTTVSSAPPKRRAGRTKFRETRHPVFKGVRRRSAGKWVCEVREPNKKSRIWLGTFPTAEMAARAHDVAAMALRGRSACLNFADSAWLLPALPRSATAREIQQAAAQAAEAFHSADPEEGAGVQDGGRADIMAPAPSTEPTPDAAAAEVAGRCAAEDGDASYLDMIGNLGFMSPPHIQMQPWGQCTSYWDDMEAEPDIPLWSYTF